MERVIDSDAALNAVPPAAPGTSVICQAHRATRATGSALLYLQGHLVLSCAVLCSTPRNA